MAGVRSPAAGVVFAAVLVALSLTSLHLSSPPHPSSPPHLSSPGLRGGTWLTWGVLGAAMLCLVPLLVHLRTPGPALATAQLPVWASVVTAVAVAEELLLRGALWDALDGWPGRPWLTLTVTSLAFALMHWPFYGGAALPLDLAVGLLLGSLRWLTGGWAGPAVAHTLADLAGWWLR